MSYQKGNGIDGKHYWLTPPTLMEKLQAEFAFDFDPCPYPRPDGFDGLIGEWGESNYVNPPFNGPTAWVRKSIREYRKGKKVVFVFPVDKWVHMFIEAGAEIRNLKDVRWHATEDGAEGPGTGRWVAAFVLDPAKAEKCDFQPDLPYQAWAKQESTCVEDLSAMTEIARGDAESVARLNAEIAIPELAAKSPFRKCAYVQCGTLVIAPVIACAACRAWALSLPSDAARSRGAEWPSEPAHWAPQEPLLSSPTVVKERVDALREVR